MLDTIVRGTRIRALGRKEFHDPCDTRRTEVAFAIKYPCLRKPVFPQPWYHLDLTNDPSPQGLTQSIYTIV